MALQSLAPLGARAGRIRFTPEEEESLLAELAGAGTSALGFIGNVLDTPGAFVRDLLAGDNPLPGIFNPDERISGRDLLQRHGLIGENYEGFDWGDVAGFGAEIATDPFTFIGGGLTKGGEIAKALGKFPKKSLFDAGTGALSLGKRTARRGSLGAALEGADDATMSLAKQLAEKHGSSLDNLLGEPMQQSIGIGLPFRGNALTFDLPGAAGRAEKMDRLGGWVSKTAPARYTAKMFDATVRNVGDWTGQVFAKNATAEMEPAKQAAGADINRWHQGLNAFGVADQDLQTDILEGITRNPEAPTGTRLSEQEILDYNVLPFDGEAPEALQARKLGIRDIRQQFHNSQEGMRRQRESLGLPAARFESQRIDYAPREATWENYGKANTSNRRRDALRDLGRTEVDAILRDDTLRELARQTEINPLSPEELTRQAPNEIRQDLANMGYEDLEDLVPWQADHMRNADPETAAMNYRAVQSTALGITPENPLSRTTALPKPKLHAERQQEAVRRVDELLGRDVSDWDKAPEWLEQARQLPKLQKELEELRGKALAGDYAVSLPEQEAAIDLQLGNAMQAREQYLARKADLDARDITSRADYLPNKEIDDLAAVRNEALTVPLWRARLKRVQDRIAAGERQIFPAEQIDELQAEIGSAEVAQSQLDALSSRAKDAKYFIQHARGVPQKALDENKRFYGNAAMHDAAVTRAKDLEEIAFARQAHKVYAGNVVRVNPGEQVDTAQMVPWTDAVRQIGAGKTASQQAQAIRAFAEELRRYGKISDEEFQNIAGSHAVASSAVKTDPVLAQELRNAELGDFVKGITGEYENRVALLQQKHTGAELAKQLADLEDRFKTARTAGIEKINAAPLTDTSHAGRLMQVKRDMHQKLYAAADAARLSGQMDDESYQALRAEADEWLKGKTKGTTEAVQEFQRLWEQAVAKDPIPDDGLLMMKNLYVPREVVDSLSRAKNFRNAPAEEGFGHWADWWRRLTKGHFTMPFASFHVRNAFNMAYQYGNAGVRDPRHGLVQGFLQPWKDAWQVLQGKSVKDFDSIPAIKAAGFQGADAERQLIAAAESYAGLKGAGDIISEGYEKGTAPAFIPFGKKEHDWGTSVEQFTAGLPGGRPLNRDYLLEPLAAKFGKQRFNPANVEQFVPIALGARLSNTTENVGRLATFIGLLRQGKSFEEAGALVKAMHVDYCVDEETEVLTDRGWLRVHELKVGDKALAISPDSREIVWDEVSAVNIFPSKGYMYHLTSSRMDAMTTGNHRWLAESCGTRGGHWTTRAGRPPQTHFTTTGEMIETNKRLLCSGGKVSHAPTVPIYSNEFVELVGWVITEGWYQKQCCGVRIAQSAKHNPGYVDRIRKLGSLLAAGGSTVTEYKAKDSGWGPIITWYFGKGAGEQVRRVAPGKQLTINFLGQLTEHQLNLLYDTLMRGDGTVNSNGTETWAQKDRGRLNGFQALCAMLGKRTRERKVWGDKSDCRAVVVYRGKHVYSQGLKVKVVPYDGVVWCPTTHTGTWMARRNGVTYWTGNSNLTAFEKNVARRVIPFYSWSRGMIPYTLRQFVEKPAGLYAQTARFSRLAEQDSGFLPPQLGGSLAIPIGQEENGTQRYLSQMDLPAESLNRLINPSSLGDTARAVLAQADPMLKLAVETATGKSLFRGRNLEDLDSTTGRLAANLMGEKDPLWKSNGLDSLLANSPASRYLGTLTQAGDKRKTWTDFGVNTLSGLRLTDVDMDKARDIGAGQAAKDLIKAAGGRTIESIVLSAEDLASMDPATRAEAERLQAVLRALAKKGKERRKETAK